MLACFHHAAWYTQGLCYSVNQLKVSIVLIWGNHLCNSLLNFRQIWVSPRNDSFKKNGDGASIHIGHKANFKTRVRRDREVILGIERLELALSDLRYCVCDIEIQSLLNSVNPGCQLSDTKRTRGSELSFPVTS